MNTLMKFVLAMSLLALTAISITAQDERNKFEVYGGYSYLSMDSGLDELEADLSGLNTQFGLHGFEFAVTGNFHRYVGVKGDFSYNVRTQTFADTVDTLQLKPRVSQFLGGVQFKDNSKDAGRVKPFAHVMAGVANQRIGATGNIGGIPFNEAGTSNNFAMVFGGGIDIRAGDRVDIRAIQFDYNPVFYKDVDLGTSYRIESFTQNNWRIGVGVVIH